MVHGYINMAVIGSRGGSENAARMDRRLYDAMFQETAAVAEAWEATRLVSGGAAWADHLAVRAYLEGAVSDLALYLPAEFSNGSFVPDPKTQFNPGRTLNFYHATFSTKCGIDSLGEIAEAQSRGAKLYVHPGFERRNAEVAAVATHALAFTFGNLCPPQDFLPDSPGFSSAGAACLKSGGTARTWAMSWRCDIKRHVSLSWLSTQLSLAAPKV